MTDKQKQHLLAYLGYYAGDIDGIYGPQTKAAVERFQKDFGITADGVAGKETEKALKHAVAYGIDKESDSTDCTNVQNNNTENSTHKNIGTFWDEIEFFDREEFRCQCKGKYCNGFPVEPEEELVRVCDEIRRRLGVPVSIVDSGGSGVRCARHNADVGGVGNSNHLYGKAADLHSGKSPEEMARVAEEVLGDTGELGIYSWGIHVGVNCKYSRFYG